MSSPLIIAIDQGGHASRALAFDSEGNEIAQAFAPIRTLRLDENRIEHDPLEIVGSIRLALQELERKLGSDVERVACAGLATQRSSIACWDSVSGAPLAPVLSWQDRRNTTLIDKLQSRAAAIQSATGLMLSPHYGASKMRWCLEHVEAVRAAAVDGRLRMAPLASYLLRSLLDEHPEFVDPANASRTLLWSPHTRDWSAELLALFDIPRSVLPTCVPSRHAFGSLPFATRLIPLQLCTGDQNAAVFADGHTANDAAYLNVGTGAFLLATLDRDPSDSMPLLRSVLYWDERELCYALEGTVNGAGSALDWLREREHVDTHTIARELSRIDEHTSIPIFINGVSGVGSPYWRAHQRTYFDGSGDARTLVVAVLESIAFLIAENFELMRARVPLTRIRATGGLIESEYLCRCVASLGRVPVERSRQQEATARGLAYLCAGMPQRWPEATVETFPPERMPALETRQARWREIMSSG